MHECNLPRKQESFYKPLRGGTGKAGILWSLLLTWHLKDRLMSSSIFNFIGLFFPQNLWPLCSLAGLQHHRYVHGVAHAWRPPEDFGGKHPGEDFLPFWQASGVLQEEKQVSFLSAYIFAAFVFLYIYIKLGSLWPVSVSVINVYWAKEILLLFQGV